MFMETKKGNRNKRGQRGFILIATIMVISLLTILVIASAVVVKSSNRAPITALN